MSHHKGKSQYGSSSSGTKVDPAKPSPNPKEVKCHYCHKIGHWKRSCPEYLKAIREGKIKPSFACIYSIKSNDSSHAISWFLDTGCGYHICSDLQGLGRNRDVELGRINLIMGNRRSSPVTKIGVYSLVLRNGLNLDLNNCCYSPDMARNIISFHGLYRQGLQGVTLTLATL